MSSRGRWLTGILLLILVTVILVVARNEKQESTPTVKEIATTEPPEDRWIEINNWKTADPTFDINTAEPLVLYKNDLTKQVLYVLNGALHHEAKAALQLIELKGTQASYWIKGNNLLLGVSIEQNNPDNYKRGQWYSVQLSEQSTSDSLLPPNVISIDDAYQDPADVLMVNYIDKPALFVLAIADDAERYREYAFQPGNKAMISINVVTEAGRDSAYEKFISMRPEKTRQTLELIPTISDGTLLGKTLAAYEDERGTLVAASWSEDQAVIERYPGLHTERLSWKKDILGEQHPLTLLSDKETGDQILAFPFIGFVSVLESVPELFDQDWAMINSRGFYRTTAGGAIDTVRYTWGDNFYSKADRRHYETNSELVLEDQGLLTYRKASGESESLSVFDLLLSPGDLDPLWLKEALPGSPIEGEGHGGEEARRTIQLKLPQEIWDIAWQTREIPDEIQKVIDAPSTGDNCIFNCDPDFGDQLQIRLLEGKWHVLLKDQLYRIDEGSVQLIGKTPVTTRTLIGEGANGYTAQDYIRVAGGWLFADTFADRIIKLNDKLEVIAELSLPMPTHVRTVGKKGLVDVDSLRGTTSVDIATMKVVKQAPVEFISMTPGKPAVNSELDADSYYEDRKTGMKWLAIYGHVFTLMKRTGGTELQDHFIGYPESGRTNVKLIPYKGQLFALSDNRMDRFAGDGEWKESIIFPKDKTACNGWAEGENSHYFDMNHGKVYLVHGCRVILVDLTSGKAEVIFAQSESQIGKLAASGDTLVFSMEGNEGSYSTIPYPHSNELISINRNTGKLTRYQLGKG